MAYGAAGQARTLSHPTRLTLAALSLVGLALSLAGASQVLATGAYATAILVGGLPIFRAAVAGLRARQLDMNVLMGTATVGAAGSGEWADTPCVAEKLRA